MIPSAWTLRLRAKLTEEDANYGFQVYGAQQPANMAKF